MGIRPLHEPLIAVKPITITGPETAVQVKITAPMSGEHLPVIVFSHGNGGSMDGYQLAVDRWAAAGFVVIQPTHLDSRRNAIEFGDPRFGTIWRVRIDDVHAILDNLDNILAQANGLDARIDHERIAVAGHSWGAQTMGTLLGARVLDAMGNPGDDFSHPSVRAGVLLSAAGSGDSLNPFAAEHLGFMRPDFSTMTTPALVVAGGKDQSALSTRGPDWFTDAYHISPSPKSLLVVADGQHTLGGIAGEQLTETTDEDPARAALVAEAVCAYLLDVLGLDGTAWTALRENAATSDGLYSIESKVDS